MPKLFDVFMFDNGMVMAFDETGEQVVECQGFLFDVVDKLIEHSDSETNFYYQNWKSKITIKCQFDWWFEERESEARNNEKEGSNTK